MRLVFGSKHISIDEFTPVEIPDFVVLTGVNGSGKSHLLEALENRHVTIDGMESAHIVRFNYETFRLENESAFNAHQLASEREQAWEFYKGNVEQSVKSWKEGLGDAYPSMRDACVKESARLLSLPKEPIKEYRRQFNKYFKRQNRLANAQAQGIYSLAKNLPYSLDEINHDDFVKMYKPYSFKNDFLPDQLGKIFWDYYTKYQGNQINEFVNAKHGKNHPVLSEDEFFRIHGDKPWDVVNKILESFNTLQYRVNSPEGSDYFGAFHLKLKHTEIADLEVDFSSLSSGEKILMALVASVYKAASDKNFPDILLLDEVDASLHPSMMKNMLGVIEDVFIDQGVKVILVTHSPTTIALAPEDSIFIMNRSGMSRIERKSKQEALQVLTQGFATLEQGLKLFDQVARTKITLVSEGFNTRMISRALQIHGVDGVDVLAGVEGVSSKNQLKTLFDFLSRTRHDNKVMVVWDCDANPNARAANNTFPFVLSRNADNTIAEKGIENMFPEHLFDNFIKTITNSSGKVTKAFDETRKRDFEEFVMARNVNDDFVNFAELVAAVRAL